MLRNIALTTRVCCTVNVFPIAGQEVEIIYLVKGYDLRVMTWVHLRVMFASHLLFLFC